MSAFALSPLVTTYRVVAQAHPMRPARTVFHMGCGTSVEDALVRAAEEAEVDLFLLANATVVLGDRRLDKTQWRGTQPGHDEVLVIAAAPHAMFAPLLISLAAAAAPAAMGLAAGSWAAIAVSAAVTIVGTLITQALMPAPKQSSWGGRQDANAPVNTIQGIANDERPYGVIPRVYGRRKKYYPPMAARPYTELSRSNDQFIRTVFLINKGPTLIEDLAIGETPLARYQDIDYVIRNGYDDDPPLTLFPTQVFESALNIELKQSNGFHQRRTEIDVDESILDVWFPNGLNVLTARGTHYQLQVQFHVQYKERTSSTWLNAPVSNDRSNFIVDGGGRFTVRANSETAIRRSVRIKYPARGQYDIRIARLTTDDQSDKTSKKNPTATTEASYWAAFRSLRNDEPFEAAGYATVELRAKATNQLNGVIDQFNCTVKALLPVWNGAAWNLEETRSHAWAYCDVLKNKVDPAIDAEIDLDTMIEWAEYTEEKEIYFDAVFEDARSCLERLQEIAASGFASFTMVHNTYSVVIEKPRTTVVQHFTDRNSSNYQCRMVYAKRAHGYKIRFPNVATRHQWDERIIYSDGYNRSSATIFEVIELPYTTDARAAYTLARRFIAHAFARPAIHSLDIDAEHLVCRRGDLVRLTIDVPLIGVGSARVSGLTLSGSDITHVTLDAPLPMATGTDYAFQFRRSNGTHVTSRVVTVDGYQSTFQLLTPLASASGPAVGDLAPLGVYGEESAEMVVRSIDLRPDMSATLTFLDYASTIYDVDTNDIPEHDPLITLPPVLHRAQPPAPQISSVVSDERAAARNSDNTALLRIAVGYELDQSTSSVRAEYVRCKYREADTDGDYTWLGNLRGGAGVFYVPGVQVATRYEIVLTSVSYYGEVSEETSLTHTVVGVGNLPPDVQRFYVRGKFLEWPMEDTPNDIRGFEIRGVYGTATDWGRGFPLHQGYLTASPFNYGDLSGTLTFMIKMIDTSGNYSANAASLTINLGDPYIENVVVTQSEAPTFGGTIEGGSVTAGVLKATALTTPLFYANESGLFYSDTGSDPFYAAASYEALSYSALYSPTSDILNDGILKVKVTAVGDYRIDYRVVDSPVLYPVSGTFYPASGPMYAESTLGEYAPWTGSLGPFFTTDYDYEIRVSFVGGTQQTQAEISAFDIECDVPDLRETFEDFATAVTTGTRLTLTNTYRAIKAVIVSHQKDGGTAVTARYVDKQANPGANGGPLIESLSSAFAVVAGTVDVEVIGY